MTRAAADWPRISIVTPSYNQVRYLERTIRSVLDQGYPNLEYIVVDGGSTDGSVELLKKYSDRITKWVSEPDGGQSDAVNKGFAMATGEIFGWQNSDDTYAPGSFRRAAEEFLRHPDHGIVFGHMAVIDEDDRVIGEHRYVPFWRVSLLVEGMNLHNTSAFWRRSVWEATEGLDTSFRFAMDYDFFLRATRDVRCRRIGERLGNFRRHGAAKTSMIGNSVGAPEIQAIRERELPWAAARAGFGAVAWHVMRSAALAYRTVWYLVQGDHRYAAAGLARRVGRVRS